MAKRKTKSNEQPNWRPNFRITETLPDTKLIRTDFLLNFVFLTLAIITLGYIVIQQINISRLNSSISDVETGITALTPSNKTALQQSAKFIRDSKQIEELNLFMATPAKPLDIISQIALSTPKGITLNSIKFSPQVVQVAKTKQLIYRLTIKGIVPTTADVTPMVAEMQKTIAESDIIKNILIKSEQGDFNRDALLGTFSFELFFDLKGDRS
ncbi:MAG: hypothetical protein SFY80_06160 [Verrucomicrobiota bacterium]|nr:hypothetical protein [Verrucomicrobiota bacterium]